MIDNLLTNAQRRLSASITWDAHDESANSECHDIAERLNAYLVNHDIDVVISPLEIHNWLGDNGVQDAAKYGKIESLVEIVVGSDVTKTKTREEVLQAFYRMIGHTSGQTAP